MRVGFLKSVAYHLVLAAMVLRAIVPAGWMPTPQSASAFVICTIDGPRHAPADKAPLRDHASTPCPFAAAAPLAPPTLAGIGLPIHVAIIAIPVWHTGTVRSMELRRAHAPRAPPVLA